jgi:polyisoprenoid-binding protein YceI
MTANKTLAAILLAASFASPALAAETYEFDLNHTVIEFGWNHFGYSNPTARFDTFTGNFQIDTADLTKSTVDVTIPIASLDTDITKLDDHLKSPDFFDAAKFPDATFKSTKVEKAGENALKVSGDLTIHGVTKPVVLDVTVNKIAEHPMSKTPTAGFDARVTVKRSDFGMSNYVPAVSDEVQIRITTETHKPKPPAAG